MVGEYGLWSPIIMAGMAVQFYFYKMNYTESILLLTNISTFVCVCMGMYFDRVYLRELIDYFRLFIVATGCLSERRPQKTVSCYGG